MRSAVLSSVGTLFADPRLEGACDHVRLTSVLLLAKASVASTHVITMSRDLAGWLGYGVSHVAHTVVPRVRESGIATCVRARDAAGWTHALDFELLPLKEARAQRGLNPLSLLNKRDLATFLRFCEAVLCPGWAPRDRPATPAGFFARRRGRGSATDRLAMLLLALNARSDGRVPMAPGRLPQGYSRSEVTVAKLLGCSYEDASAVLKRLLVLGGVEWDRPERYGQDRLLVPAIRDAYERARAVSKPAVEPSVEEESPPEVPEELTAGVGCGCCGGEWESEELVLSGDGWAQLSFADVPLEVPGSACGDQKPDFAASSQVNAGFDGASGDAVSADPHAAHPPVVSLSSSSAGALDCFSGSAVLGEGQLPERAGAREDRPGAAEPVAASSDEAGPLRGEQHKAPTGSGLGSGSPVRTGSFVRPVGVPEDLKVALAPVAWLWAGLGRASTGAWLAKAVRLELVRLRSFVGDAEGVAERRLAERLKRRLDRQGTRPVQDLAGWLIRRGLPQEKGCWSNLCDDGIRIDSGGSCPSCDCLIGDRRGLRRVVAADVAARNPYATAGEWRGVYEAALRAKVEYQGAVDAVRRERAAEQQVAFYAAIEEQKAQLAEDKARRAARPCEDCGRAEAAGLCMTCALRRSTKALVDQAVDIAVALRADVDDPQGVALLTEQVARDTWSVVRDAQAPDGADDPGSRAFAEKELATKVLEQRRQRALSRLRESQPAEMEAAHVRRMALHGMFPTDKNRKRAEEAAAKARDRVAQELLRDFLGDLHRARATAVPRERPSAWSERCLDLAARPLFEDTVAAAVVRV
ncbi:hypothetical protein ACFW2K_22580 [Streptomyces nigra]|uniref:hypothetical protein n=1 Tax=Streptomyces nigra TaxID=1827580 RepID=UPI003682917C